MRCLASLTLWLASLAGAAESASDQEYVCHATAMAPAIDGDLGDACWQSASQTPVVWELGAQGKPVPGLASVRLLYDSKCLYLGADVRARPGSVPKARREATRDQDVFSDESLELYLHTAPGDADSFHFVVNCGNATLDSCSHKRFRGQDSPGRAWNAAWRHATRTREGAWSVEMAIPLKELVDEPPRQGLVWRVKVGINSETVGHAMWPRNESSSFGEPTCAGYLIFGDRNLLTNGNFEGPVDGKGRPAGWAFSYHDTEGKGVIRLCDRDAPEGKQCVRYEKTTPEMWFPQLWSTPVRHQAHSTYRLSFLINADKEFVVRHTFSDLRGQRTRKRSTSLPATRGYERREILIRAEDESPQMAVGIQLSNTAGVFWVDDVRLERVNGMEFKRTLLPPAHAFQRLERLAERRPFKPYDQLVGGSRMQSERVIFKDTATGAQIWRVSHTPGGFTRHHYMEASPWNCDGSILMLGSDDWDLRANLRYASDAGKVTRLPYSTGWWAWDRQRPDLFYVSDKRQGGGSAVYRYEIDGGRTLLRNYQGSTNVWAVSQDNKYLLVRESFPGAPWNKRSMVHLLALDGREDIALDPKGQIHQLWFTKLPDHSAEFEYEHGGHKPGDYPDGNYMITKDGRIRLIYGGPGKWAGHRAHSPSGRLMLPIGHLQTVDKLTGQTRLLGLGSANHMSWEADEAWATASSGDDMIRFATDGRDFVHRIASHNSGIGHSTYWTEAHVEMSPDGTKLGYASSMLGDIDFHFAVMMLPGQPTGLTATRQGPQVRLAWQTPKHAKELAGYLVYRSRRSGECGTLIAPHPVSECEWTDTPGEGVFYYQVASLERCGLEGLKSNEACSDPAWPGTLRLVFECESAPVTHPPAMEAFDTTAAGLYAMNLGMDKPAIDFTLPFTVPRTGSYSLWLRAKSPDNAFTLRAAVDGRAPDVLPGQAGPWQWLRVVDRLRLPGGPHAIRLAANLPHVLADQLVVTDEPSPRLGGQAAADVTPPPAPKSLVARATGSYSVRLKWNADRPADLHHFNLYAARSPECKAVQENLVASPADRSYVDWGRQAGTTYYYRLTAVDRSGNESLPTAAAAARTEPIGQRLFERFAVSLKTRQAESVKVAFDCPAETPLVLWTRWQSFDAKQHGTRGAFRLVIDGKPAGDAEIRFGYICRGHGGPVLGHGLWNYTAPPREREGRHEFGYRVGPGQHTIEVRRAGKDDDLECGEIIVTNDFGFLPTGAYTSFLPLAEKTP